MIAFIQLLIIASYLAILKKYFFENTAIFKIFKSKIIQKFLAICSTKLCMYVHTTKFILLHSRATKIYYTTEQDYGGQCQ